MTIEKVTLRTRPQSQEACLGMQKEEEPRLGRRRRSQGSEAGETGGGSPDTLGAGETGGGAQEAQLGRRAEEPRRPALVSQCIVYTGGAVSLSFA